MSAQHDQPILKNSVEARQGVTGHNVRYVLAISVTAVIVAFGAVMAWFFQ